LHPHSAKVAAKCWGKSGARARESANTGVRVKRWHEESGDSVGGVEEMGMRMCRRDFALLAAAVVGALVISGCASNQPEGVTPTVAPAPASPEIPASIRAEQVAGRWGYGAYHRPQDSVRTEAAARAACGQPVTIERGPNGGVMMYLADSPQVRELALKGSTSGQNYIGPPGPSGGMEDREIVSFDGRTMVLKWMDPEVAGRYGIGIYVRCAPGENAHTAQRPKPKAAATQ
jgi:hypothetical protein